MLFILYILYIFFASNHIKKALPVQRPLCIVSFCYRHNAVQSLSDLFKRKTVF